MLKEALRLNALFPSEPCHPAGEPSGLGMLPRDMFLRTLSLERKRTERSNRHFLLMLLDLGRLSSRERITQNVATAIMHAVRATDILGWYKDGMIMGAIFTELGASDEQAAVLSISRKVTNALSGVLSAREVEDVRLSFHVFPENWDDDSPNGQDSSTHNAARELLADQRENRSGAKRVMDLIGSAAAIILLSPLFLVIVIAVKLTSDGPVLFRQVRVGRRGRPFTFLKFRSMYVNNDQTIHEEYVSKFISGSGSADAAPENGETLYKLTGDPRVTPLGRFLRKASLDELPQFFNVLKGDMSLVGPRPPVAYEFTRYCLWHRQRLAAVKPGITGLWQVEGRSRVKFDDMVRLDLRYARSCSLWLDFKILARTPRAVLIGEGAC